MGRLQAAMHNWYEQVRFLTDPLLDQSAKAYWGATPHYLRGHFPVVIDLFGPRIKSAFA
jgi:hypothetical protein